MNGPGDAFPARFSLARELGRKLIHLAGIVLPIAYVAVGSEVVRPAIALVAGMILLLDVLRLRWGLARRTYGTWFGPLSRTEERRGLTGATYFAVGQAIAAMIFPPDIAPVAMSFGVVGDTAAALVGRAIGGPRWRPGKTLAGTSAFVVAAFLAGIAWGTASWETVLLGAVVAALAEGLVRRLNDNIAVPLAGGVAMWIVATLKV